MQRPPQALTVARVSAVEIALHWRWAPILLLATVLLAYSVLPLRYPGWEQGTLWLVSLAVVLAGEAALLLHELSHALVARGRGQPVERIIFHGFLAETVVSARTIEPRHEALIALAGPGTNLGLAGLIQAARMVTHLGGPLDVVLALLLIANLAMLAMSLLPVGRSDGWRVARALLRAKNSNCRSGQARARSE
jgi:Zn-dependent protease